MIDLRNTCVLVRTKEENEMLLKEAEKQGFQWPTKNYCRPLPKQHFPDILKFYEDKDVTREAHIGTDSTFYEASELLGTKEMSAREFAERIADVGNCCERECIGCVLDNRNNKCNTDLCNIRNWKNNIDELLEIAKVEKWTVPTPEEKAIENIEKFIENPDRAALNDEFVDALKLAVEKLEEVKQMERLTLERAICRVKIVAKNQRWNSKYTKLSPMNEELNKQHEADYIKDAEEHEQIAEWLEELKSYKDLEEQGLLVRLPCPIGTTVWDICGMDIRENVVSGLEYDKGGKWFLWANEDECLGELNVLVFLNREEAENKLEELKNEI